MDCQNGGCSAGKVVSTGTTNVTRRDEMVHALETIRYVLKARDNLIFIGVLDEEDVEFKCNKASSQLAKVTG